jgi:hypothetical protein
VEGANSLKGSHALSVNPRAENNSSDRHSRQCDPVVNALPIHEKDKGGKLGVVLRKCSSAHAANPKVRRYHSAVGFAVFLFRGFIPHISD